jgi:hypothetical protein
MLACRAEGLRSDRHSYPDFRRRRPQGAVGSLGIRILQCAVLMGVALVSACHASAQERAGLSSPSDTDVGQPFTRAVAAPSKPPEVALGLGGTRDPFVLMGSLYEADWMTARGNWQRPPTTPVAWPHPANVKTSASTTVTLQTSAPPDEVEIRTYEQVDASSGQPTTNPAAVFHCNHHTPPICPFKSAGAQITIDKLSPSLTGSPYVVVFATWPVPPDQRADSGPYVSASWLFRLRSGP